MGLYKRTFPNKIGHGTILGRSFCRLRVPTKILWPTRYTYPVNEQNLNQVNYDLAASAIGGDNQTTKLFWDVN